MQVTTIEGMAKNGQMRLTEVVELRDRTLNIERLLKSILSICVFFFVFLFVSAVSVSACGCFPICSGLDSHEQCVSRRSESAIAIFSGKVLSVEVQKRDIRHPYQRATIQIERAWKGIQEKKEIIVTAYFNNGANCGFNFTVGQNLLIYARENGDAIWITECDTGDASAAKILDKLYTKEIKNLEKRKKNKRRPKQSKS